MARRRQYDDDDGRVIAKMNVEGMPWYVPGSEETVDSSSGEHSNSPDELTKGESFWIFIGAMRAGCLVAAIAIAGLLIGVGICLLMWR